MKQIIFLFSMLIAFSLSSCSQGNYSNYNGKTWEQLSGSGKLVKLNPVVEPFKSIEVDNLNVKVVVETGAPAYAMNISIDDNLQQFFKWKQEGSTLKLSFDLSGGKYPRWLSETNATITIKAPTLESLTNKGNSKIDINLNGQATFNLVTTGNPGITVQGKIAELAIESTGNADINAAKLLTDKIILSSSGNADIEVNTKELVEKSVNGNNEIINLFYGAKSAKMAEKNEYAWNSKNAELINFKLKNNSALPAKVTMISYRPDEQGNGTTGFTLFSYSSKTLRFPAGTKIYLADSEQVNTVMSGAKISDQPPFLIVKKEDEGKVFDIK